MATAIKHPTTHTYRVRKAIPKHLRETTGRLYGCKVELIENLGTKDGKAAAKLAPAAVLRLQAKIEAAQATYDRGTANLSDRDIRALAGEFYRAEVQRVGDNPGAPETWADLGEGLSACVDQVDDDRYVITPTEADTADATGLLTSRGLPADAATVRRLATAVFEARWDLAKLMERRASGDWSPDPTLAKLPSLSPALPRMGHKPPPGSSFDALLEGFALDKGWGRLDAKPISRALYDRKRTLARLGEFLGHTEASRVTKEDAVRWKEDMQRRGLHASTVRNDLSECSAVWRWAARNAKLPDGAGNPFEGISPPKAAKRKRDVRAFTTAEAATILKAARAETGVLRWAPWVCCMTGARISEVCQSVREDVTTLDGVPVIRFHDEGEGRSIKNADSRRTVPIHPALQSEGFLAYVNALPAGSPLFPDVRRDALFGLMGTEASRRVSRWLKVRLKITDERISPNHSWRHTFVQACRSISMPIEVRSALTGHSAKLDESAGYGAGAGSMVALLAEHLARVPGPLG